MSNIPLRRSIDKRSARSRGWSDLFGWQVERDATEPLFRQVYRHARSAILSRKLRSGAKLPSTRWLAAHLEISRSCVIEAYEQLLAEGYAEGKIGSGTFVSVDLPTIERNTRRAADPMPKTQPRLTQRARDFADAAPSTGNLRVPFDTGCSTIDAVTVATWASTSRRSLVTIGDVHLSYSDPRGISELRTQIAEYLRAARGANCEPDQVIVTSGTQQGLDLALRVALDGQDEIWMEDPCYELAYRAAISAGLRVQSVPVDAEGLLVSEGIRSAPRARAVIVTPSHQYPLGMVLSMRRRLELLDWARDRSAWIIEDDYDSEFRYAGRPLAALQGLDENDRVIYLGTFSKSLFPGLRLGYAVVPRFLVKAFTGARYLTDRHPPTLSQEILTKFMSEGHYSAHIRRARLAYRSARDILISELKRKASGLSVESPEQGRHVVGYLQYGRSDTAVSRAARNAGMMVRPLSNLYRRSPRRSGLLLGFAGFSSVEIKRGTARLAKILDGVPA
jgi:GntR family transcriptional regulator / MocR family aminotransferase